MFQSKLTVLHLKSGSYSFLIFFCPWHHHSLNFPGWKPQCYLVFPPCPSALHPTDYDHPQIRSSLFSSHFDNSRGLLPVSPTNSILQTSPPEALLWSWLTPTIRTLMLQHAGAPASFLIFSSSRTNYTFSRERKGKLSKRTEWSAQEKSKWKFHICPQWINVLGEKI